MARRLASRAGGSASARRSAGRSRSGAAARTAASSRGRSRARSGRGSASAGLAGLWRRWRVPQRHGDLGHAHRHARVAGLGRLDRVHGERADGIGELGVGSFGRYGGVHRRRANYTQRIVPFPMNELPFARPQISSICVACETPGEAHWFVFRGDQLLVEMGPLERALATTCACARGRPGPGCRCRKTTTGWVGAPLRTLYLGRLGGAQCWAAELPKEAEPPAGMSWEGLRTLFTCSTTPISPSPGGRCSSSTGTARTSSAAAAARRTEAKPRGARARLPGLQAFGLPASGAGGHGARQEGNTSSCSRAARTSRPACTARSPASSSPASRSSSASRAKSPRKSACRCRSSRYFASQSWPFPHSLMIAFVCEWVSGEIRRAGVGNRGSKMVRSIAITETSKQNLDRSKIDRCEWHDHERIIEQSKGTTDV